MTERKESIPTPGQRGPRPARSRFYKQLLLDRRSGPTALIALAALVGFIVWLVVESRNNSSSTSSKSGPEALSLSGLKKLAGTQAIYWVGARPGATYEITRNSRGTYLRYLPPGAKAGDKRRLLTIATYPFQNAYAATKTGGEGRDTVAHDIAGGGIATYSKKRPTSVYVAYPGAAFQVEVYHPDAARAQRLARSGRVQPVVRTVESQARGPVAVSPPELKALASSLGHPIYWAGPRANTTYELWQTPRGYTFIRYLPAGVAIGSEGGRYLIVATYPMKNAFEITRTSAAKGHGTVRMKLPNGGTAAYAKQHTTNVYVAYPSGNVQIEVYDPSPNAAPLLVKSGRIVPAG